MADDNEDPFDQFAQWCNEHWEGLHHIGEGKIFFLNPEETGDPSISYLDLGKAKSFSFTGAFIPFQTAPETVADFIPDDGSYTMDEAGLWTHELLRGWPVRFG